MAPPRGHPGGVGSRQQHQYSVHNAQTENSLSEILELCAHPHSTPNTMPSWLERRWPGLHIAFKTNFLTPDDAVECSFGSYLSSSMPEASVNTVTGNGYQKISHLSISDHSKQLCTNFGNLKTDKFCEVFRQFLKIGHSFGIPSSEWFKKLKRDFRRLGRVLRELQVPMAPREEEE